ncbi:MAG: tetratricopeptide repeat protein, partial [Armatimonadetes bacterium]|nr:tetratricopeptide repeat protein [Armatimonadota bacterium]
ASSLNNLAELYRALGQYEKAEPLYVQAMEILRKVLGEEHPHYAVSLNNLARLYDSLGQYEKAEPLYVQAMEIRRKVLGEEHPHYATSLNNLAELYAARGRNAEALSLCQQASGIEEAQIDRVFSFTSEKEKLSFVATIEGKLHADLSLVRTGFSEDAEAVAWALGLALRRKGLVLDSLLTQQQAAVQDPGVAAKRQEWRQALQQSGALLLRGPGREGPERHRENLRQLAERKEKLEAELSRLSADFARERKQRHADASMVATALPPGSALVEIVRADIVNFKATRNAPRWKPAHYFAFVLRGAGDAEPVMIDLGLADDIDQAVGAVRDRMEEATRAFGRAPGATIQRPEEAREEEFRQASADLYRKAFAPVRKALGHATLVYVAPDGELNRVAFESLVEENGKYLIESYRFAYLSSGRDLLRT